MSTEIAHDIDRLYTADPDLAHDPYPLIHSLRAAGPVLWVDGPAGGPHWRRAWHCFDYESVALGLRDPRFSSRLSFVAAPPSDSTPTDLTPRQRQARDFFWEWNAAPDIVTSDPPDHTRLRGLVVRAFTPRVVNQMTQTVEGLVAELLDAVDLPTGRFDIIRDLASPLPTLVICALLGVPVSDWPAIKHWSDGMMSFAPDQRIFDNLLTLHEYWTNLIAARRATPGDDLLSRMIAAREGGDFLSDEELIRQCMVILVAGHETTTFALGNAVVHLLRAPDLWAQLPDLEIAPAIDELLRYDPPFQVLSRQVLTDLTLGDQQLRAGDLVQLWISAANRDPVRFPAPDAVDLARADNRHLTFGRGSHFCLGAALARLELQLAVAALRARFPRLRLVEAGVRRRSDTALRGFGAIPVAVA